MSLGRREWMAIAALACIGSVGCTSSNSNDAGPTTPVDSGQPDSGPVDAGAPDAGIVVDAGPVDAGPPAYSGPGTDGGTLTLVTFDSRGPSTLAISGPNLYWLDPETSAPSADITGDIAYDGIADGGVFVDGGDVVATGQSSPENIWVDSKNLYWVNYATAVTESTPDGTATSGSVVQASLTGSAITTIASAQPYPSGVVTDSTYVYWADQGDSDDDGFIMKTPIAGGALSTLAKNQINSSQLAVDSSNVYWVNAGTSSANTGAVVQLSLQGGTPSTLVSSVDEPVAILVDSANIYWATYGDSSTGATPTNGGVYSVPIGGTTAVTLASNRNGPTALAQDATNLYWTEQGDLNQTAGTYDFGGAVVSVPKAGGSVSTLVFPASLPDGIAVSGGTIYFSDSGDFVNGGGISPGIYAYTP